MRDTPHSTRCPYCGRHNDMAGAVDGESLPGDGDVSLCFACGHAGIFDSGAPGGVRKTTAEEAAQLAADKDFYRVRLAWLMMDQKRRAERA